MLLLTAKEPPSAEASDLFLAFMESCDAAGVEPYPTQVAAFEAIFENRSVVLATPTGSGKSLVALAAHFACYWRGHRRLDRSLPQHLHRSVYTAPTKALVNEKFFNLCDVFGASEVGLMTGDATVNAAAPIICCTAEILESIALRQGRSAPFGWVVMDEFHYFSDPERGSAWLVPLLEMIDARFLLMSATLHDEEPAALCADLERRTGAPAAAVCSKDRPVPLEFVYQGDRLLMETIEEVREKGLSPVYIVSFRRRDAAELAPRLKNRALDEKARLSRELILAELEHHRLDTPFGRKLRELLPHGLAVHHGGMLPKYRRLVERLATRGLISVISGTDTLGVGVNMPIRAVIFTQLSKGGGERGMSHLRPGEFRQIAGRAGRKGHDTLGTVLVQPPEHEVLNARKKRKTEMSGKKFFAESPPRGFKGWNEKTLEKLRDHPLERLVSRFAVTGPLVLQILKRPGDGRESLQRLIDSVGSRSGEHRERAELVLKAFEEAGLVRRLERPDADGCLYDLTQAAELLESFDRPLVPFVRFAIDQLDLDFPDRDLAVLSVVESVLDDPKEVLDAQQRKAREARRNELWQPGQSMEEANAMKDELEAITWPQPMAEEIGAWFSQWEKRCPFMSEQPPSAKSVARDLLERATSFADYVRDHDLVNHEHTLYHYLGDVHKVLARAVPPADRRDDLSHLIDDLAALVDHIDASVAEEWARRSGGEGSSRHEQDALAAAEASHAAAREGARRAAAFDQLLRRMVRTRAFAWVTALSRGECAALTTDPACAEALRSQLEPYWGQHDRILTTPDARGPDLFEFDLASGRVRQWILDPDDARQWFIEGEVDLAASREAGQAVLRAVRIGNHAEIAGG